MRLARSPIPLAGQTRATAVLSVTTAAPTFHPGIAHRHAPCGRWDLIQKDPNSSFVINRLAPSCKPFELVNWAIDEEFGDKPNGRKHLNWYLFAGGGKDFVEDALLDLALRQEVGLRRYLKSELAAHKTTGIVTGHVEVDQSVYGPDFGQDVRFAWGALDRLDFEADYSAGTFHAWFQDFYEWHPVYPKLYTRFSDDEVRPTNAVHAALVELKTDGAADFWMKGEATVPLSAILSVPPRSMWDSGGGTGLGTGAED